MAIGKAEGSLQWKSSSPRSRRQTDTARPELWRGYLDFYETQPSAEIYEQRLIATESSIRGLGARLDGTDAPLIGIAHYLFHAHAWTTREVCYLQDLFVDSAVRRSGCGRRLIEAVAAVARDRGCLRLYWTTKEDNAVARSLCDRIARFNGFIRYDHALRSIVARKGKFNKPMVEFLAFRESGRDQAQAFEITRFRISEAADNSESTTICAIDRAPGLKGPTYRFA